MRWLILQLHDLDGNFLPILAKTASIENINAWMFEVRMIKIVNLLIGLFLNKYWHVLVDYIYNKQSFAENCKKLSICYKIKNA